MKKILEVINHEGASIEEDAKISAYSHFLSGRRWNKTNLWLGIPSTALAAFAGGSAFADFSDYITGSLALIASLLAGINAFLSPGDRTAAHHTAKFTFGAIQREARLLRTVETQLVDENDPKTTKETYERLRQLSAKYTEAEQNAPLVNTSSLKKAETKFKKPTLAETQPSREKLKK